jgi:hypothetical protein
MFRASNVDRDFRALRPDLADLERRAKLPVMSR